MFIHNIHTLIYSYIHIYYIGMYDTEDITVHDVWWGRVEPLSFTIPPTVTLPSIVTYEYRYVYIQATAT